MRRYNQWSDTKATDEQAIREMIVAMATDR